MKGKKQQRLPHCQGTSLPAEAMRELGKTPDQKIADRFGLPVERVRLARALRGIAPRRGRNSSIWTPAADAMLGTMSDACLARKMDLSPNAVTQRRQSLGIAPFGLSTAERRKKWTKQGLALLGKVPDRELAEQMGITISSVVERRMGRGIASCTGSQRRPRRRWTKEELALLGKLHDSEVARRLGIGRRFVRAKRRSLGIPAKTEKEIEARWTKSLLARLGQVPDRQLAAEMGLTPGAVSTFRQRRGIPRFQPGTKAGARREGRRAVRKPWTPELTRRLGTVPDAVIAQEMGLTRAAVAAHRSRLGILPCHPPPRPSGES